jgi:hypothetical protein
MKTLRCLRSALLTLAIISTIVAAALGQKPKEQDYNMASHTYTGETLFGAHKVVATNLNTIRYNYTFANSVTYTPVADLWTGLQGQTTTKPTTTPTTATGQKPQPPIGTVSTVTPPAGVEPNLRVGPKKTTLPDPFVSVNDAIKKADAARTQAKAVNDALTTKLQELSTPINDLADKTKQLAQIQTLANNSTAQLAQGGAALIAFLSTSPDDTPQLVAAANAQLKNDSTFTMGLNAAWPKFDAITKLQTDLIQNTRDLTAASQDLTAYIKTETPLLQSAVNDLLAAQTRLTILYEDFTNHNSPTKVQSDTVKAEQAALTDAIDVAQKNVAELPRFADQMTAAIKANGDAVTNAAALAPGSTAYKSFVAAHEALSGWHDRIQGAVNYPATAFQLDDTETCKFAFSSTKKNAVTLTRVDQTPGVVSPKPETVLSVVVECTTPFSVSAGVAFSTVPDNLYAVAAVPVGPATGTTPAATAPTIVQTSSSTFHPLPLAMINARLYEWSDWGAVYASFGIAANTRNQSAGGSTAEYLLGPSIGLFRYFLFTPGVYFGSEATVGNGYAVGSIVPTTVTTVPVTTRYKPGFGLGITFTKP